MDDDESDHSNPTWWDDTASDSTTHALRWDLHGMSPRHPVSDNAGNRALSSPADHNQHPYALSNTPKILPFRSDQLLQVFKDSDRYTSASPAASSASTAPTGSERHHHQDNGHTPQSSGGEDAAEEDIENINLTIPRYSVATVDRPLGGTLLDNHGAYVGDIGNWYFITQMPERDLKYFRSAENHWVKGIWDMARVSTPIYAAIGSFALHKKAAILSGREGKLGKAQYFEQKGRMIQDIFNDIDKSNHSTTGQSLDPLTVVAIAMLAYLDIRDGHLESAGTHLKAVRKFIEMPRLPPHAWLYCVWIDLRYALFLGKEPELPFYIPAAYRELPASVHDCQPDATRKGFTNAFECPRSSLFTLDMARDLFRKLHALCYCSDTLVMANDPPFGQVYALEYGLRVVQSRAATSQGDQFTAHVVLLLTSAIQLHVWMASRFWTPQRQESHFALIMRACQVIESFDDMITQWYISAGLESLLWVLFTIVASLRAHELSNVNPMLELLYKAVRKAEITRCEELEVRLRRWPWLSNWHPAQVKAVWAMLCARHPVFVPAARSPKREEDMDVEEDEGGLAAIERDPEKARSRWFVGGLEFFNSL
jgi:hypothetical protein